MPHAYHRLESNLPARGVWTVPVPWRLVPVLAAAPAVRQLAATCYADPTRRRAALVLWPGVDPHRVAELVGALDRARPAPAPRPRALPARQTRRPLASGFTG